MAGACCAGACWGAAAGVCWVVWGLMPEVAIGVLMVYVEKMLSRQMAMARLHVAFSMKSVVLR